MRTVVDIYETYRIPPWLQEHQLRVGAVGKMVCGVRPEANERHVVLACLFHDMGNILKFDFAPDGPLAPLMAEKGVDHWRQVQDDFLRTYGKDEHEATVIIGREIGLPAVVIGLIEGFGLSRSEHTRNHGPLELKAATYADMRVNPFGIVPMYERFADIKERYAPRWAQGFAKDMGENFERSKASLEGIETELFQGAALRPEDINDESVAPLVEELKKYEIS